MLWNNLALLVRRSRCAGSFGWKTVLTGAPADRCCIAGAAGVWLFYVQHQFEEAYWAREDEWNSSRPRLAGSSFYDLPRVLHWFTGNIGYHHIHHLSSRVPNYRLRDCFESGPRLQARTAADARGAACAAPA